MALELPDTYQRLPVYLVIDTSGSMAGAPITAVNEGLKMFERVVQEDPQCRETAHISLIRFASDAVQVMPLTEAGAFVAPPLKADGGTALARGLKCLREAIHAEVKPKSSEYPGDYKPLVFLFTDGQPNPGDLWREQLALLNEHKGRRPGLLVVIGAGPGADVSMLRELSPENTHLLADLEPSRLRTLFQWIAASTIRASAPASHVPGASAGQMLAPAPPNLFAF